MNLPHKTQKANGVWFIGKGMLHTGGLFSNTVCKNSVVFNAKDEQAGKFFEWLMPKRKVFVRPCPLVPQHGFVESAVVDKEHLWKMGEIFQQAKYADPSAEIIIQPVIGNPSYSGILTDGRVTIGVRNDGVTSGKGILLDFIVGGNIKELVSGQSEKFYEEIIKESPYVEFVKGRIVSFEGTGMNRVFLTQLRDGPKVGGKKDWIPEETEVKYVFTIIGSEDLSVLSSDLGYYKSVYGNGLVVYLKNGSLTSHAAVQARILGIPVVTSHKPEEGEILKPEEGGNTEIPYEKIARYAAEIISKGHYGDPEGVADYESPVALSVAALHGFTTFDWDNPVSAILLAFGLVNAFHFSGVAVAGEMRHWWSNGPGRGGVKLPECLPEWMYDTIGEPSGVPRDIVWDLVVDDIGRVWELINSVQGYFSHVGWGGGYGGESWERCMKVTRSFGHALTRFLRWPNEKKFSVLMEKFNQLINVAHNNGRMLTKFVAGEVMDALAVVPGLAIASKYETLRWMIERFQTTEEKTEAA